MFYVNEEAAEAFNRIKVIADWLMAGQVPDQTQFLGEWLKELATQGLEAIEEARADLGQSTIHCCPHMEAGG